MQTYSVVLAVISPVANMDQGKERKSLVKPDKNPDWGRRAFPAPTRTHIQGHTYNMSNDVPSQKQTNKPKQTLTNPFYT
jgi:hypothetical protein